MVDVATMMTVGTSRSATAPCAGENWRLKKMRDLKADLEICRKATPGPWVKDERVGCVAVYPASIGKINCMDESEGKRLFYKGGYQVLGEDGQFKHWDVHPQDIADAEFIAQAREGWPHAIERAVKAETLVRELVDGLQALFDGNPHDDYEGWKNMWGKAHASLEKAKEVLGE